MKKSIILIVFFLFAITTVASLWIAIYSYNQVQSVKKLATKRSSDPDEKMLATIGSVVALPEEKPTIVNITDRDKLQDQEFFKKAQNGDKVVIYESVRRIFLYRPSLNKIIDIAPLVFTGQQTGSQMATQSAQKISPTPVRQIQKEASDAGALGVEEQGNFRLN